MTISLQDDFLQVWSVQRFVEAGVSEVRKRRSLAVILPDGYEPEEIWEALRYRLERNDFRVEELSLGRFPPKGSPALWLCECLGVNEQWLLEPEFLMRVIGSPPGAVDVICLAGFDSLPAPERVGWISLLEQWTRLSQVLADRGGRPTTLCIVTRAEVFPDALSTNAFLAIRWLWGVPAGLDIQMLCRIRNESEVNSLLARWREHVLPAVAGNDLRLVDFLWDQLDCPAPRLYQYFAEYGRQRGWTQAELTSWGARDFQDALAVQEMGSLVQPPQRWYPLWIHGVLWSTPESGLEMHTAALMVLGNENEVKHRCWRGQAGFLLPLLDDLRLSLCERIDRSAEVGWPLKWIRPMAEEEAQAIQQNPLACQFGHLERLLSNSNMAKFFYLHRLVRLAQQIRNELAHYRPIDWSDAHSLVQEARRCQLPCHFQVLGPAA